MTQRLVKGAPTLSPQPFAALGSCHGPGSGTISQCDVAVMGGMRGACPLPLDSVPLLPVGSSAVVILFSLSEGGLLSMLYPGWIVFSMPWHVGRVRWSQSAVVFFRKGLGGIKLGAGAPFTIVLALVNTALATRRVVA